MRLAAGRLPVLLTLVAALAAPAPAVAGPQQGWRAPLGTGAARVWVLRPEGPTRSVVVFAHGWSQTSPRVYRPWLDHLLENGSAIVFPWYQNGGHDTVASVMLGFRRGLTRGFAALGGPRLPVVAAGYSFGGSLAFDYAALAASWRLPAPAAVLSVFPALPIGALPPRRPLRETPIVLLVGDRDVIAGRAGADAFWSWLRPARDGPDAYRLVRSAPGFVAQHRAPEGSGPAARRAFWAPLDGLIAGARSTAEAPAG